MTDKVRVGRALIAALPSHLLLVDSDVDDNNLLYFDFQRSGSGGNRHRIRAKWIGEGWPKQVENALHDDVLPDVFVCRHISPGAKELAEHAGVGWVDETGAAQFVVNDLVVKTSGIDSPPSSKSPRWTKATLAIAEALLTGTVATVEATQSTTGLSIGTCVRGLKTLTELGLLTSTATRGRNSNRNIRDLNEFLTAYREAAYAHRLQLPAAYAHVLWRDPVEYIIENASAWDKRGIAWAATGVLAAQVIAPYLTGINTVEIYVERQTLNELNIAAQLINGTPSTDRGARLILRPFPTVTSQKLIEQRDGLSVVPLPRLYADLFHVGVRGGEAAEHLREVTGFGTQS